MEKDKGGQELYFSFCLYIYTYVYTHTHVCVLCVCVRVCVCVLYKCMGFLKNKNMDFVQLSIYIFIHEHKYIQ